MLPAIIPVMLLMGLNVDSLTASLRVETGFSLLEQGLVERAIIEFESAMETFEAVEGARLGLGRAAALQGSWDTAEEYYLACMERSPWDHRPSMELAEMLTGLSGRAADACSLAGRALALSPLDGECHLVLANALSASGEVELAIAEYETIIAEYADQSVQAGLRLGLLLYNNGNLSAARNAVLHPASAGEPEAWRILTLVYLDQKDYLRAGDSAAMYLHIAPYGAWTDSARLIIEETSFQLNPGSSGY